MTRISPYIIFIGILLAATASWHFFHGLKNNSQQNVFAQGFLKGVAIPAHNYLQADIAINDYRLEADIAGTSAQQQTGLAIKSVLKENQGMLFPFANEGVQAFWMKDMKFPIDILWIDKNNTIVYVQPNLPPCVNGQTCPIYQPSVKVIYVLEVVAGFAQKHHVIAGQTHVDMQLVTT